MLVTFGALIKTWRKEKRLSYKDLARESGVSGATLARWETGRTQPRMSELEAVLLALQVSASQHRQALTLIEAPRAVQQLRDTAGIGPPVSGDLLRAMRLRQRWTQQETARRAGISQAALARWESSSDWPSSERLHTLCYVLQAREEELLALTQGALVGGTLPDQLPEEEEVRKRVAEYLFYSPVADLEFLALEAHLWKVSLKHRASQRLLSHVYGCYARYLAEHHRFEEATPYVERTQQMASSGYRDDNGWSDAVVAASRVAGSGGRTAHLKRAVNILHTCSAQSPIAQDKAYTAWVTSEIAMYLSRMGQAEPAILRSRRAVRIAGEVNPMEAWFRRGDHAKILLQIGRYEEALEECRACLSMSEPPLRNLPFMLTGVQALLGACRSAEAMEWLLRIYRVIDTHPEAGHHRALADALSQRLSEARP